MPLITDLVIVISWQLISKESPSIRAVDYSLRVIQYGIYTEYVVADLFGDELP